MTGDGTVQLQKDVTRLTTEIAGVRQMISEMKVEVERLATEMIEQRKYADQCFVRKEVFRFLVNVMGGGILIGFSVIGTLLTITFGGG